MKRAKRILAIVLATIMIFGMIPASVFATEATDTAASDVAVSEEVTVTSEEQEAEATVEDISEDASDASSEQEAEPAEEETVDSTAETEDAAAQGTEPVTEEKVEEPVTLTEIGNDYTVTATFDASSGLPAGVQMKVSEIKESGENAEKYEDLYDQTLEAVQKDTDAEVELTYARFFDITFYTENGEVEPSGPVSVNIKYDEAIDVESSDAVSVYHFDEQKEEIRSMDIETAGSGESVDEISFETDGFSIYAVVGTTQPVAESRMTLNFYKRGSDPEHDTLIATVYVKNSDSEEDLEKIIYDPGAGELESGQLFKGWIEKRDYTVTDANSEEKKSIPDIRSWAEGVTITEDEVHNFYAMVFNTFSVVYKDEEGITIRSEALIFDGTDVTYTIDQLYTPADQDEEFQGWIPNDADLVTPKDVSLAPPYKNGTEVTISGNVILSVNAPKGHWLNFEGNGKGATYTPPQFIVNNSSDNGQTATIEPNPPTRNGYQFAGWYTGKPETEGGDPTGSLFTFGQSLGQNTTLYAKWTQNSSADYYVIIWKQRADDDKDASDNEKKYDVAEVKKFTGTPGASASNIVTQTGKDVKTGRGINHDELAKNFKINNVEWELTGFHAGRYDQDINIDPEGTSVVNVYYDRNLITISFDAGYNRYIYDSTTKTYRRTVEYTGLYDSELYFIWPTQYYSRDLLGGNYNAVGATIWIYGNQPLTFLGSFKYPTQSDVYHSLGRKTAGSTLIRFIRQKPNGEWPEINETEYIVEIRIDDTGFYLSNKFAGYSLYQYKIGDYTTDNSGWNEADDGQLVNGINRNNPLNIRFVRKTGAISFMDGTYFNGEGAILDKANPQLLKKVEGIYYQDSTASYNKDGDDYYDPLTDHERPGYYFAGWYLDSTCTQECIFDKMPENGITVYAKWIQIQYRVFLHPNVPSNDESFNMGNQSTSFLLDYGEKVANGNQIKAQRDAYELIGWYTDPDCKHPFNFEIYEVNDTNVITPYDRTEETERDKYGNVKQGQAGVNKDADNNRIWVNRKLDLYAKWRSTLDGAKGIDVIYDAGEGTNAPTDGLQYLDNTEANAGAASTPKDPEKQQFKYWVVQQWDNTQNKYVDTDPKKTVYPGDVFTVLKANAKVEVTEWVNPDNDTDVKVIQNPDPGTTPPDEMHTKIKTAKYTVSLRAEYGDKDAPTPTHIYWYANNGTGDIVPYDNLKINEAKDIVKPEGKITNNGRKFLGWARLTEVSNDQGEVTTIGGESPDHLAVDLSEEKLFLEWDAEEEKFLATEETQQYGYNPGDVVTQIAADEKDPYHGMVAVWAAQYGVYHSSTGKTNWYDWPATNVNLTKLVADGCLYGGYYEYDEGSTTHKGAAITINGTDMTPDKGKVYYLKEVDGNYLRPNVYLVYSRIYNGLIQDLYGFVNVDSIEDYPERGLIVDGVDKPIDNDSMVSESIVVIRNGETYATLTPDGLFNQKTEEVYFGYTSLKDKISENTTVTITGYYITKDNIKVTGNKDRIIRFAGNDPTNTAPVFTGWGSGVGQTLCGLKSRQQTNEFISGRALSAAGLLSVRRTLTLMAPSDQLEYTITKVYDTGTEEQTVQEGNHTGEVNYTPKEGYLFAGWYTDQAFTEPADFSNVQSDMTVYARFVNKNDISLTLSRKSQKSGKTTFNAVVTVKDKINLENVTISVDGTDIVLSDGTVKKTGSGKYMRYTTRYNGEAVVYGLSMFDSFTTSVGWTTPDGTVVTGPAWKCTYFLGMVSVE